MRIVGGWRTVCRPASVSDADIAGRVIVFQHCDQIGELALGPAADQLAAVNRANPSAVIATIFHPFQSVDQAIRDR